ncbi:MAG TPA: peptidoglycan-binding domain-containing protein [Solirubrobacteraceae bacterium]
MADTRAHKRSTLLAAILAALAPSLLVLAAPAAAATGAGGTLATGGAGGAAPTSAAPATGSGPARPASASPVRISRVSCVPAEHCSTNPHQVSINGTLQLQGAGLRAGMIVVFPRSFGARISRNSPGARLRQSSLGLVAGVPGSAHSGRIMVLISSTRHTGSFGPITIVHRALHPPAPRRPPTAASGGAGPVSGTAFDGQGMWIWYMSQSNGGSVPAIAARAHASGVTTLFIKSSDGSHNYWSQFSPQLIAELHANGLKACAWQYVYGSNPAGEAELGARAVANGADCLVIDAEAEYEGHYAAAQTYINTLRAKIGPTYPLGLASFPYVSYHASEPYSVFLGPGGAQYNAPQMYWHDIGVSVDTVYANTYIGNRIYSRPIFPLGQTYGGVSSSDVLRFREEAALYGASGLSFWDWQETPSSGWSALAAPLLALHSVTPNGEYPELRSGRKGDQVLWLQEHLASAVPSQEITGNFGSQTTANLQAFQTARGLPPTGVATPATWSALLALAPVAVNWTGGGPSG